MNLQQLGAIAFCATLAACSSSGESSGQDASELHQGSDASEDASSTEPSDSSAPLDASSSDATPPQIKCVSEAGPRTPPPDASCSSPDDTDRDGVPDCIEGCPYDPEKIAPGVCGCGIEDIDSDGDGVADCMDLCPRDPNNTRSGQCGCAGQPGLKPAGTLCTDTACPQSGATCNGAGVCGDRSACVPCPGGRLVESNDSIGMFWFCGTLPPVMAPSCMLENGGGGPPATRMAAQNACVAKGMTLPRIQSLDENRFVTSLLTSPIWIGANDLKTPGQWYWSSPTSDSDTLFWNGGPDGSREDSFYFGWVKGAPGAHSCASMGLDGHWLDADCSQMLAYVCEYLPPI